MMKDKNTLIIFDTTLRDGEQAPGAAMSVDDKVAIARRLAEAGIDVIEAGFPASSPAQMEAVRRIAEEVDNAVVCALARATASDIHAAGEAVGHAARSRIHTFIATSDIHIDAKFGDDRFGTTLDEKRATVIALAQDAVRLARTYTDDVEFSAEDAGRTDPEYLCRVVQAAVEAGATTVNIPDTTGYCTPDEYGALIRTVGECLADPDAVVISAHCHDDLGLAVANSLAAVKAGARQVEVAVNGIGERAGNASLEEVTMAIHVRPDQYPVGVGVETTMLTGLSRQVSLATSFPVPPNKAIVGRNAFSHEAGIHQHGVLKRADTYEIMRAEDVGQTTDGQIRLGRHSGRHGFFSRLQYLRIDIPADERDRLFGRFIELADRKREIYDQDLIHLAANELDHVMKPNYRLNHIRVAVDSSTEPRAEVEIRDARTETTHTASATGDGPVDALYRAIDDAVGTAHELASYSIRSVTEGADAIGEVTVLIGYAGAFFRGSARSTDVLYASAAAYVHALNQLESFRDDEESRQFIADGIMNSFNGETA
jgi:2-isopropylmalate synthase